MTKLSETYKLLSINTRKIEATVILTKDLNICTDMYGLSCIYTQGYTRGCRKPLSTDKRLTGLKTEPPTLRICDRE